MKSGWQWVALTGAAVAGPFVGTTVSIGQTRWEGTFGITGQTLGTLAAPAQSGIGFDSWTMGPLVGAQLGATMNRSGSLELGLQATPLSVRRPGEEVTGWAFSPSLTARMRFGDAGWVTPTASLGLFRTLTSGLQAAGDATTLRGEVADRIRATGAMIGLGAEAELMGGVRLGAEVGGRYTRFDQGDAHRLEPTVRATLGFTLFGRRDRHRQVDVMRLRTPIPPDARMFHLERDEMRRQGEAMRHESELMQRQGEQMRRRFRLHLDGPEGDDHRSFFFEMPEGAMPDGKAFGRMFPGGFPEGIPADLLDGLPPDVRIRLDSLRGQDGVRVYRFDRPRGRGEFIWSDSTTADGARILRFERRDSLDTDSSASAPRGDRRIEVRRHRRAPAPPPAGPPVLPPPPPAPAPAPRRN